MLHRHVWLCRREDQSARYWYLIVTPEPGRPGTAGYSLSNAAPDTSSQRLAQMQRQSYCVERAFQDAKDQAGLDEYQACSWTAWYHHVGLVMMAMLFLLCARLEDAPDLPLLSTRDVKIPPARYLPRQDVELDDVIRQMQGATGSAKQPSTRRTEDNEDGQPRVSGK